MRCPRLVAHRAQVRESFPTYQAHPIGAWGPARARLLIVGLAPGLHGAARTGKAFVGDASGEFLFAALYRAGLCSSPDPHVAKLLQTRITNAVKCLPPGNAPNTAELNNCATFLQSELSEHYSPRKRQRRVVLALGGVAYRSVCKALGVTGISFEHDRRVDVTAKLRLVGAFHPSRLNVNTKRLTPRMLDDVFAGVRDYLTL